MDKQAKEARQMAKKLPFKQKIQHFWYYYKWYVIVITAVVLLASLTIYQFLHIKHYDLDITCFTENTISDETLAAMEAYFSQFVEDVNGDGVKDVKIYPTVMRTDAGNVDAAALQQKFIVEVSAGTGMAYLFDESYFQVLQADAYVGVAEAAVRLTDDQALAQQFGLPQNTPPLYWITKTVYQTEADKEERVAMHDNAVRIQKVLEEHLPLLELRKPEDVTGNDASSDRDTANTSE